MRLQGGNDKQRGIKSFISVVGPEHSSVNKPGRQMSPSSACAVWTCALCQHILFTAEITSAEDKSVHTKGMGRDEQRTIGWVFCTGM